MDDLDTARSAALRDLGAAEAARVLGLLDTAALPARARRWVQLGLTTPAAAALAAGTPEAPVDNPAVLLATLAAECGVSIHDPVVARSVHAEAILTMAGQDQATSLFTFSNSITDGITGRLRRWWRRGR